MEEAYCTPQLSVSKIKLVVSPPFKPSAYPHLISSFLQLTSPGLRSSSQRFRSLFFFFFYYVFIVCIRSWALRSSLQVCGIFGCCLAGSGSLTRNQTGSLPWENKLLATGPPGKALKSLLTSLSSSSRSCHLHSNTAKPLARMFLLSFLFYFPPS